MTWWPDLMWPRHKNFTTDVKLINEKVCQVWLRCSFSFRVILEKPQGGGGQNDPPPPHQGEGWMQRSLHEEYWWQIRCLANFHSGFLVLTLLTLWCQSHQDYLFLGNFQHQILPLQILVLHQNQQQWSLNSDRVQGRLGLAISYAKFSIFWFNIAQIFQLPPWQKHE